jgi:polyprenyldihydroxybenzoate methyltransferase / 3-demethylubiquinol 3-O-methyltransferase
VVEHVENQREFLRNCMKLVKPKTGHLFMSTIAKTPEAYFLTILSKLFDIYLNLVGEYVTRIVPMGTHEWSQYIDAKDVESILSSEAKVIA